MKIFISQPMNGLSEDEIKRTRLNIEQRIKQLFGNVDIINSFYLEGGLKPLFNLGRSIQLLSEADIAYFAPGWSKARGCRIEYMCASDYGIETFFEEE